MKQDTRAARQQQIEQAAYAVLEDKGYAGASMLAIARHARASNETLYNWYGDKSGLFKALVTRNAAEVAALIKARLDAQDDPIVTLAALGPMLVQVLTGARAVALNRAAAADPTGELGIAISQAGRDTIAPMIAQVLERARAQGQIAFDDTRGALDLYLSLLIGDLQIRRVIGQIPELDAQACQQRGARALAHLQVLMA